jgi:16S rRNA (guanine(527)-N(7))-methyltransferase RsmG
VPTPEQVPDWFSELLARELSSWAHLSQLQVTLLYQHYDLLIRWNRRMNLTTVKPGPDTVIRHYCESLFFAAHLPAAHEKISVLDLGSGAGFPGIPMGVLKPSWNVTLVESSQRKAVFLRESSRHLLNISVRAERMEDLSKQGDWAVARAVDPRVVLLNIPRLAANVGLMLGEDDFSSIRHDSRIAWAEPVRLPWGDRKISVYGVSSTWNVPRETSKWEK